MIVTKKTPCFGVMCAKHENCQHYALVNKMKPGEFGMGFCKLIGGQRQHFIQVEPKEVEK